jgi:hypothetical protein
VASFVAQAAHGRPNYADPMFISDAADPQDLRSAQRRLKQAAQRTGLGAEIRSNGGVRLSANAIATPVSPVGLGRDRQAGRRAPAKRSITMAVLLSFSSFDETRISAARSRRWFGSLTHDAHYELRGCHASKSVFPFRYERVAAKQSLTSRLAAVRSRDVGRQAAPTTGGLGAPMFHPPTARLFHEPTWQPWSVPRSQP